MKDQGKNREIENLFRKEFSEYSVEPSAEFEGRLRRKLQAKEFLRFNPGRFNVWYLGGIVATAILVGSLIYSKPDPKIIDSKEILPTSTIEKAETDKVVIGDDKSEIISKGSPEASEKITTVRVNHEPERISTNIESKEIKIKTPDSSSLVQRFTNNSSVDRDMLVKNSPKAMFSTDFLSGCLPLKVSFDNLSSYYDSCLWEFGDGGYSKNISPVWVFDEEGDFEVTLVVFGQNGQKAVTKHIITVYPLPKARFEIGSGDAILPEEMIHFFNYSDNSVSWEWTFGDGTRSSSFEPDHSYNKPGSYIVKLIAKTQFGCVDSMTVTNAFDDNSCYIKFPNAFIPNSGGPTGGYFSSWSDERSEVFHPVWSGVTQYQLRIFSRMGILVFETNDIDIGWDGYIKGEKAESGVYIWKVRGLFKNGDPFVQAGDVTILPK